MTNPTHKYSSRAIEGQQAPSVDPFLRPASFQDSHWDTNHWHWFTDMLHSWVVGYGVPARVPPVIDSWEESFAGMVRHVHTELDNAFTAVQQFKFWRRNADETIRHM